MARLYSNENFPFQVVEPLRALGHDVITSLDAGNAGRGVPDEEVLAFAVSAGLAVLTLNRRHFIRLHLLDPAHYGIVVCTFDHDFLALANRIHVAVSGFARLDGQLVRVSRPNL